MHPNEGVKEHFVQCLLDNPGLTEKVKEVQSENKEREKRFGLNPGWAHEFCPKVLPVDWKLGDTLPDGQVYARRDGLLCIVSAALELDGRRWLHVSASRRNSLPTYKDLREIKQLFIGKDRLAIQIFPSERQHVNLHIYVLHLFCCLEGDCPLPDFTHGTGSI